MMYTIRPVPLLAFGSLRKMTYPGIDKSQYGILAVGRDSEYMERFPRVGEGGCDVGNLVNMINV